MKIFKFILRALLFLFVLSLYYVICIGTIISRGNPAYADNMVLNILMLFAIVSPFLVIHRIIKWLSPDKKSRVLNTILSLMIVVGVILHYIGKTQVDKETIGLDSIPMYAFYLFLVLCLLMYKPPKAPDPFSETIIGK
jgi:hypothetical protein